MKSFGLSDIGLSRQVNEDSFLITENPNGDLLVAVCDGIGGSAAGEVASNLAVTLLGDQFQEAEPFKKDYEVDEWLRLALNRANDQIFAKSMWSKKNRGMGTTAVGAVITSIGTYIFNVGDSRLYALYEDGLIQMSEDHSVIQSLINQQKITPEEAIHHKKRNTLTNALGVWRVFRIDVNKIKSDYRMLLICSDGLSGYVEDGKIESILSLKAPLEEKTQILIDLANKAGGHDNCTVILVDRNDG
ncbi:Stp1/IreP family PP2C-type Ser/Thr phosphatase [Ileibacterium valens]|uniref:Serine/threonine protein phosphatase n=1 Tax=Ileibacterium valens TaxID=1862668 RepID=A0A1U7NGS8_9FIRM|nr:Stp1/IreP family PP2C-type Ser/Thr phosphatase [Ileibacterium valens]OLU40522.1 serine/threonine protein phosphatase [Ileibacterium valens]OLU41321.1 serine/threonine protein phosphatase [Erysipelotrichaceae bacterium NYU-BL-F16]OLU42976.1 serine/threonine protein phosphatase [Erysipelotrichaceae bacterium NYU-BL-E8]